MSTPEEENALVAVKWHRPGHQHHNVVHLVSRMLVSPRGDRVVVRWPWKGKEPDIWEGTVEDGGSPDGGTSKHSVTRDTPRAACSMLIDSTNAGAENEIQPLPPRKTRGGAGKVAGCKQPVGS